MDWDTAPRPSSTYQGQGRSQGIPRSPLLGKRLMECAEALLKIEGKSAAEIFGYPDDLKLRSSMSLSRVLRPLIRCSLGCSTNILKANRIKGRLNFCCSEARFNATWPFLSPHSKIDVRLRPMTPCVFIFSAPQS